MHAHHASAPRSKGYLAVNGGHQIYYEDWGNPNAKYPVFYLHGGPGAGFNATSRRLFDLRHHRVIFHDQRGSGQSVPYASTQNNTTRDLILDIEALKKHLGISGKINLAGGSWGSTLSLAYALTLPQNVHRMLIWSIFLGKGTHVDFMKSSGQMHFPEAWERFIALVPPEAQDDPTAYYAAQFEHPDEAVRTQHVIEWTMLERSVLSMNADLEKHWQEEVDTEKLLPLAKLEAYYFLNGCFMPTDFILQNAHRIAHIPIILLHGRYDFVCPARDAYLLKHAIGDKAELRFLLSGHTKADNVLGEVLRSYTDTLLLE